MNKIYLLALAAIIGNAAYAQELYIDQPAVLIGKLSAIKSLHPNPEFYGERQIAIRPTQVLKVRFDKQRVVSTQLIQLISPSDTLYQNLFAHENKMAKITCSDLFEGHTAHHTTKVLCTVEKAQLLR